MVIVFFSLFFFFFASVAELLQESTVMLRIDVVFKGTVDFPVVMLLNELIDCPHRTKLEPAVLLAKPSHKAVHLSVLDKHVRPDRHVLVDDVHAVEGVRVAVAGVLDHKHRLGLLGKRLHSLLDLTLCDVALDKVDHVRVFPQRVLVSVDATRAVVLVRTRHPVLVHILHVKCHNLTLRVVHGHDGGVEDCTASVVCANFNDQVRLDAPQHVLDREGIHRVLLTLHAQPVAKGEPLPLLKEDVMREGELIKCDPLLGSNADACRAHGNGTQRILALVALQLLLQLPVVGGVVVRVVGLVLVFAHTLVAPLATCQPHVSRVVALPRRTKLHSPFLLLLLLVAALVAVARRTLLLSFVTATATRIKKLLLHRSPGRPRVVRHLRLVRKVALAAFQRLTAPGTARYALVQDETHIHHHTHTANHHDDLLRGQPTRGGGVRPPHHVCMCVNEVVGPSTMKYRYCSFY
eukprot:Rhum_TRINITY_DN2300_c0_g1::Rhum_TRINITY_DN2300_c0_g1_i1::g.6746::m.6746